MDDKLKQQFNKELEKEKIRLLSQLEKYAKKDKNTKGDWRAKFPNFGDRPDENAEEVATYESWLAIEQALELKLADVEKALKKIKDNNFGQCEKCKKEIETERLRALPEAKLCIKCKNNINQNQ
jgi:DnaK suppressor protein